MESVAHVAAVRPRVESAATSWYLSTMIFASTCIMIGIIWDISWHLSIGRDTFWSPPHAAVYLGAVLAGFASGAVALRTTFGGSAAAQSVAVRFWGFRAPLGSWIAIWGSFAMLASAPFDNWWHEAYGLDIGVFTPPHSLLVFGIFCVNLGVMLIALSSQNRASAGEVRQLGLLHLYAAGIVVVMLIPVHIIQPNRQHGGFFYEAFAAYFPFLLVTMGRSSRLRWAATTTAAVYMLFLMLAIWILPLFPATPKLGPINTPITHMAAPPFPLLLVIPALAADFFLQRREGKRAGWLDALAIGVTMFVLFFATQWFLSEFLLSPGARNWFIGGDRFFSYAHRPGPHHFQFWWLKDDPMTLAIFARSLVWAVLSTRVALWCGAWMSRVQR
jgi:hypothetical protein